MTGAAVPQVLLEPIAADANPANITAPMPDAPPGANAASIQQGFPPITMLEEQAGGKPPLGPDMNGLFFLISSHTMYVQCGQLYLYNSTLATAIGGYLAGTVLGQADGKGMWLNLTNGNTSNPDTGGAGWTAIVTYGFGTVTGLTGGTVTLTAAQAKFPVVVLSGTLTSNLTVNFPGQFREWLIVNNTTGTFSVTANIAGGAGISVPQGGFGAPTQAYSDTVNLYSAIAPLSIPIDQDATPLTIVERTNAGYVLASYFNMGGAADNFAISNVFYETANDGFIRKTSLTQFESQMLLSGIGGQLANGQVPFPAISQWAPALFASAALTGTPTAPTAGLGTTTTQIATTAFANPGVVVNGNGTAIRLPSGYILQFGTYTRGGGTGSVAVTFPVAFPNAFGAAVLTGTTAPTTQNITATSAAGLTVTNSGGGGFWIAIGN